MSGEIYQQCAEASGTVIWPARRRECARSGGRQRRRRRAGRFVRSL